MSEKKGIGIKIAIALIATVLLAGAAVGVGIALSKLSKPENQPPEREPNPYAVQLDVPQDVHYNNDNYILTFEGVEYAKGYEVKHNSDIINIGTNTQVRIDPFEGENTFSVRAKGDKDNLFYYDSDWSETISFFNEVQAEKTNYEMIRDKIMNEPSMENLMFERIDSIVYADATHFGGWGDNVIFQTVWRDSNGAEKNYEMGYRLENCENVSELFQNFNNAKLIRAEEYDMVNYDSAECLIKSNDYAGYMQELQQKGYSMSVLNSVVRKGTRVGNGFTFQIVGTFKAERDDGDVKYFTSEYNVNLPRDHLDERVNYEYEIQIPNSRKIIENYFENFEDPAIIELIEEMAARQTEAKYSKLSTSFGNMLLILLS